MQRPPVVPLPTLHPQRALLPPFLLAPSGYGLPGSSRLRSPAAAGQRSGVQAAPRSGTATAELGTPALPRPLDDRWLEG